MTSILLFHIFISCLLCAPFLLPFLHPPPPRPPTHSMIEAELAREKTRRQKAQRNRGTRHSSFGGTFVVKNQKSISGKERVYHRPLAGMSCGGCGLGARLNSHLAGLNDHSYDVEKRPRRTAKTRRPANDVPKERMSTYSIAVVLKNWSVQFLQCCYNILMKVVRVSCVVCSLRGCDLPFLLSGWLGEHHASACYGQ